MNARVLRYGILAAAPASFLLVLAAAPASAHVSVNPKAAEPGSYARLTFRVPNERPDSATVKLEVALPKDQPLRSVAIQPVPGWTARAEKSALAAPLKSEDGEVTTAVSKITWSGGKVQPGEFQEFDVSVGPLPETGKQMVFKAIQTYDNGEVVRWIDVPAEGSTDKPEHPAPVLALGAAGEKAAPDTAKTSQPTVTAEAEKPAAPAASTAKDGSARVLGGFASAAGLLGILLGVRARGTARRSKP